MSRERPPSSSPRRKSKQRIHGLKMQTLPLSSELKNNDEIKTTGESEEDRDDEYSRNNPQSSFEKDEDFKFKRHRSKNGGVSSLGERLDNLQELERARWMDNFNSSVNIDKHRGKSLEESPQRVATVQPPHMAPPYMPYMYYYPIPPMMPMTTSPTRPVISQGNEASHYLNSSQGYPNTSTQPFLPIPPPSGQLMPPPPLYPNYSPYSYYQSADSEQLKKTRQRREKRKSVMEQRGRRLSMLSFQDNSHIISPHKDVPEEDFYRHIANTSFGQDLQIRQLFNWCFIRALRKRETVNASQKKVKEGPDETYVDPNKIAMVIMKEFVHELRKGLIQIDWEAENNDIQLNDKQSYEEEDTELRELFDDDEEENRISQVKKRRKTTAIKIPNEKNLQNSKSLLILQEQVDKLKAEIQTWVKYLDVDDHLGDWSTFKSELEACSENIITTVESKPTAEDMKMQLVTRMDRFYSMCHFLSSYSQLLSETSGRKLQQLKTYINNADAWAVPMENRRKGTKELLQGLSKSLVQ
ncbi:LAFE_0D05996g1_1 [Lachancea fermentati]|uniref:LAFE_0D05996g1_1 n=1 Tax=Lachancea fermentati TaxID=4955 RepID=A0A1G4MBA7_LACFM|nr:LAFE_0D05996g1_1 [Lachancea fermentati]